MLHSYGHAPPSPFHYLQDLPQAQGARITKDLSFARSSIVVEAEAGIENAIAGDLKPRGTQGRQAPRLPP